MHLPFCKHQGIQNQGFKRPKFPSAKELCRARAMFPISQKPCPIPQFQSGGCDPLGSPCKCIFGSHSSRGEPLCPSWPCSQGTRVVRELRWEMSSQGHCWKIPCAPPSRWHTPRISAHRQAGGISAAHILLTPIAAGVPHKWSGSSHKEFHLSTLTTSPSTRSIWLSVRIILLKPIP